MGRKSRNIGSLRKQKASPFRIRKIRKDDSEQAAALISRLKKLNGEFDPLLKTSANVDYDSLRILKDRISDADYVILVAVSKSKIVGVAKATIRDRVYYEPRREGAIVELYIIPEFRRGSLGRELFDATASALRRKGANLITAEFPSQNEIAHRFYTKLGFRSLTNVYAKAP